LVSNGALAHLFEWGPLMISEAEPAANSRAATFSAVINGENRLLGRLCAFLTIGISVSVLFGWVFSVEPLKTIWPGGAQMKVNTAAGLAMAGLSLFLATLPDNVRRLQAALGIIVSLFGAMFLLEYGTGRELGVDNLLFHDPSDFLPGRPSVSTSLSFVAVGFALALMRVGSSVAQALRSTLAVSGIVLALTALLGYFVTPVDSSVRHVLFGFAIHTAASFLLLSIGILAAGSRQIETNRLLHLGAPLVGLVALVSLVVISLVNVEAQKRSQDRISRATAVVSALTRFLSSLQDVTAKSRGYLLTGDEGIVAPFNSATKDLRQAAERLALLTANDSGLADQSRQLQALMQQKLEELRQELDLKRGGDDEGAVAKVRADAGKATLDKLRQMVSAMQTGEELKAESSRASADRQGTQLQFSTLLTIAVVAALAIFLFLDARRRFSELRAVHRQLAGQCQSRPGGRRENGASVGCAKRRKGRAEGSHGPEGCAGRTCDRRHDGRKGRDHIRQRQVLRGFKICARGVGGQKPQHHQLGLSPSRVFSRSVEDDRQRTNLAWRDQEPGEGR
jgi:CHASE3 domain sensor protein